VRHLRKLLLTAFFLLLTTSYVAAQTGCTQIVERALIASDVLCRSIQNNEACYGHTSIQATARPNVTNFTFTAPGHVANIATIQEMQLAELNEARVEWGIAHLRLQGNIPGTLPGQFVTILAFGSVDITDPSPAAFTFSSGVGAPRCAQAPNGILIRTPEGIGNVQLTVNRVLISLGSTAFLQAEASNMMNINLLSGNGTAFAEGVSRTVPQGSMLSIPMTSSLGPGGPPSEPQPLDLNSLIGLPLDLLNEFSGEDGTSSSQSSSQPPAQPIVSNEPCMITTLAGAELRVGPGTNRTVFNRPRTGSQFNVTGQNVAQGETWWQIDKTQVGGSQVVNELWIRDSHGTTAGNCANVGSAAPPPIVPFGPTATPVATDEPAPPPSTTQVPGPPSGPPIIDFYANTTSIYEGDCVTFTIVAQNIDSVYLYDPLTGVEDGIAVIGTRLETRCFSMYGTYTFILRVVLKDGTQTTRSITIEVLFDSEY